MARKTVKPGSVVVMDSPFDNTLVRVDVTAVTPSQDSPEFDEITGVDHFGRTVSGQRRYVRLIAG